MKKIGETYLRDGEEAAESRFVAFLKKGGLRPDLYFAGKTDPEITEADREHGERFIDGWLVSVGVPSHFEKRKVDWFSNPTYNQYAEWTLQLSRHEEWLPMNVLYRKTRDERYAEAISDYLNGWIDQTELPPDGTSGFHTMAWRTLECGLRLDLPWPDTVMTYLHSPSFSAKTWTKFFISAYENAHRLVDASTSHNWVMTEMAGLTAFCCCFPFYTDTETFFSFAMNKFSEQIERQVYPDNFQIELSTGYHTCVINALRNALSICRRMNRKIPDKVVCKLADMYLLYPALMAPDGATPDLNDGGRISVGGKLREAIGEFPEKKDLFIPYLEKKAPYRTIFLPYAGMTIFRSGWESDSHYLLFDAGPFGFAHQHEDKLHIVLHAYGKKMIDDPGNFAYDNSEMRKYVISTYSHSTATINGLCQNRGATYHWMPGDEKVKSDAVFNGSGHTEYARGVYCDGYGADLIPIRHERTAYFLKEGIKAYPKPFFVLHDVFTPGDGKMHSYRLTYHLEDVPTVCTEGQVFGDYGDGVGLTVLSDGDMSVVKGQREPYMLGWHAIKTPGEHAHIPTPTVCVDKQGGETEFLSALIPTKGEKCPIHKVAFTFNTLHFTTESGEEDYPL